MMNELVPVIQPDTWPGAGRSVHRPFFSGQSSPLLVAYAVVTPQQNTYLTAEGLAASAIPPEDLEDHALRNWVASHHDLDWQPLDIGIAGVPAMSVRGTSDVVSTLLLSHGHLKGLHKHFGSELLSLLVPDRFTIIAHPDPGLVMPGLARSLYDDAAGHGTQLSPHCYSSMNGEVVAFCTHTPAPADLGGTVVCCAFLLVASADGTIDRKEIDAFTGLLEKIGKEDAGTGGGICRRLVSSEIAPLAKLAEGGLDGLTLIGELATHLEAYDAASTPADAAALRDLARHIARSVASASGSGLFGLGSKISRHEKATLEMLDDILNDGP